MGLMLGNRQLAMLREMGVRVWQPKAAPNTDTNADTNADAADATADASEPSVPLKAAAPARAPSSAPDAIKSGAARAHIQSATGQKGTETPALQSAPAPAAQAAPGAWFVGPSVALYPLANTPPTNTPPTNTPPTNAQPGKRWLVLLESSGAAVPGGFNPLEGDAGKLLDNMLRAANMHAAGGVVVAPLLRVASKAGDTSTELSQSLPELVASAQPAVVLVMGRLAAQAALQSSEPLAKLRGRVHQLLGTPCIVTLDPAYLLRNPLHKAMAWDDLCLALSLTNS